MPLESRTSAGVVPMSYAAAPARIKPVIGATKMPAAAAFAPVASRRSIATAAAIPPTPNTIARKSTSLPLGVAVANRPTLGPRSSASPPITEPAAILADVVPRGSQVSLFNAPAVAIAVPAATPAIVTVAESSAASPGDISARAAVPARKARARIAQRIALPRRMSPRQTLLESGHECRAPGFVLVLEVDEDVARRSFHEVCPFRQRCSVVVEAP